MREDMARLRTREEEQRNQVMQEKQKSEQEEQQKLAIFQLQEEGRLYLNRVRARLAAKGRRKARKERRRSNSTSGLSRSARIREFVTFATQVVASGCSAFLFRTGCSSICTFSNFFFARCATAVH